MGRILSVRLRNMFCFREAENRLLLQPRQPNDPTQLISPYGLFEFTTAVGKDSARKGMPLPFTNRAQAMLFVFRLSCY